MLDLMREVFAGAVTCTALDDLIRIAHLLIVYGGAAPYVAYVLPVLLMAVGKLSALRLTRRRLVSSA